MANRYDADFESEDPEASRGDRQQSFFFLATLALAATVSLIGTASGFVYGDYYGRKHAQLDSPELRKHYAGECYSYVDTQLKKTIKSAFEKQVKNKDQSERLEDIRGLIVNLQMDVSSLGQSQKPQPGKRKVASVP